MSKLKMIKFNKNYRKLHGQKTARLVAVFSGANGGEFLSKFPDFIGYDETATNGQRFHFMENEKEYIMLLFVGDKDIMFPTFRKQNEENAALYSESVGELFEVVVEEPKEG